MTKSKPVICVKCGVVDKTTKAHVGTNNTMRCVDCADNTGRARQCRKCCPTNHGTLATEIREAQNELDKEL
jgi:hypothetical protein